MAAVADAKALVRMSCGRCSALRQRQQRDRAVIILHHPLMRQSDPGPARGSYPPLFTPVWADDAAVLAPAERRPVNA